MKKITTVLLVSTAIITATSDLRAQDSDKRFHGFYGGIEAGFDQADITLFEDSSLYYGLNLGYRHQTSRGWVWGIEGSFGDATLDIDDNVPATLFGDSGFEIAINSDFQWSAIANAGKAFGKDLISLRVGIVGSQFDISSTPTSAFLIAGGAVPINLTNHEEAYLVGVQYERGLSKRLSLKVGFDFIDYGAFGQQFQQKTGFNYKF